jgi:hypothetical protein
MRSEYSIETSSNPLDVVRLGAVQEMDGLIKLELTAEEMVEQEAALLRAYVADDARQAQGFWQELKEEVVLLELEVGQWLLSAADPSRVEWQDKRWWGSEEDDLRH